MDKNEFLKQLNRLVSFKGFGDNLDEKKKTIEYITTLIPKGVKFQRLNNNGVEILIAGNRELFNPDLAFITHADVVQGENDLFDMRIKKDVITGRGVSDMKFSIPIGISLLKQAIDEKLNISFTLVVTTDEEQGGVNGMRFLVSEKKFRPKAAIVPDWGDNYAFTYKSKGVAMIEIESTGRTAHASEIWLGHNSNESLCILASRLLSKYSKNNNKPTWNTTMNIGVIQGGIASNQVCDKSIMKLDFRFPKTVTGGEILAEVKREAKKIDKELKVKLAVHGIPTFTDLKNPCVKTFINSFEETLGTKIKKLGGTGATDARYLTKQNIPLLVIKPRGGNVHSPDEWISISSCLQYHKALTKFIHAYENKICII